MAKGGTQLRVLCYENCVLTYLHGLLLNANTIHAIS